MTSSINSVSFDDDDDSNIVISSSGRSCWRFSEEDDNEEEGTSITGDNNSIYLNNVVIKTENAEDATEGRRTPNTVQMTAMLPPQAHPQTAMLPPQAHPQTAMLPPQAHPQTAMLPPQAHSQTTNARTGVTVSVGNVSRIKDKSKVEREYAANAVKKVNDLLRNSELSHDEEGYINDETHNNALSQEEIQQDESEYVDNQTEDNQLRQLSDLPPLPPLRQEQPQRQVHYFESKNSFQHEPSRQYVQSPSSSSGVGSSSVAFSTTDQYNNQEGEQVIKLIHTSDATLPYMCSACNMHSSNLGVMKQHIADHKKGVIKCPLLGLSKNVFICPFGNCDFNSPNYARVLTHLNRFHGSVAQHLIKQITSASLPEAVEALNDPVSPLCQRESIWKEVALQKKPKVQSKLYACSECDFKDYNYKTVIVHLQGHLLNQNKKQKTG